jgi:hypothetical protein
MNELTFNKEGYAEVLVEGKVVRVVRESDLIAVKGGAETRSKEWEGKEATYLSQIAEANRLRDEKHQALLQAQAASEQLTQKYSDYDATKTKVGELEKTVGSHKESLTKYEKELGERIKATLINVHKAKEDALKDKTLDQLRNLEDAAKIFGNDGKGGLPAKYDGGSGVSAGVGAQSARKLIHSGWDALHPEGK